MVGPLLTLGIPSLKPLYEDDTGVVFLYITREGKYTIHTEYFLEDETETMPKELIQRSKMISDFIDQGMKQRGIKELYTWGENKTHERWNKFLGYSPTGKIVNEIEGELPEDYPNTVEEYKKVL